MSLEVELAIEDCWHVVDDLKFLWVHMLDGDSMSTDDVVTILSGMETMYTKKFEELHRLNKRKGGE